MARRTIEEKRLVHTRRDHLKALIGSGAALSGVANSGSVHANTTSDDQGEIKTVTVTEGTNIAATASPDSESIVIDLHGILFRFSKERGEAEPLTDIELEPARPDYAPDGSRIAFQGYRDGKFDIWTITPDGSDVQQVTDHVFYDDREPAWSPDGTQIAFSSDRGETYDI